jgi:hypothetical protein
LLECKQEQSGADGHILHACLSNTFQGSCLDTRCQHKLVRAPAMLLNSECEKRLWQADIVYSQEVEAAGLSCPPDAMLLAAATNVRSLDYSELKARQSYTHLWLYKWAHRTAAAVQMLLEAGALRIHVGSWSPWRADGVTDKICSTCHHMG